MIYIIILIMVIVVSSIFYYYKPKKQVTKNIFNAEYYRGLNYLLNNEEEKAFKIFAALMDVDSSTIETHLALGGLYRKRGEFDKAILIHQNLLSRPTLESELKNQALYELARDFYSAGLYDRSEKIFNSLSEIKNYKNSCLEQLLKIYEGTKDWEKAINLIKSVNYSKMNKQNTELLLSQYYCEISKNYIQENQLEKAIAISKKALKTSQESIRPNYQLASYYSDSDASVAIQYYNSILKQNKSYFRFIITKIIDLSKKLKNSSLITKTITEISKTDNVPFIPEIYFYILYEVDEQEAKNYIESFDLSNPLTKFTISHTMVSSDPVSSSSIAVSNIVNSYKDIFALKHHFVCSNCGYKSNELNWLCPSCNTWETMLPKTPMDIIKQINLND